MARWHQWQPIHRDNVHAGARLAYGEPLDVLYRFDQARVVLAVDGDFLDEHPAFVRHALDFSTTRHAHADLSARSRLYAIECTPTLSGANADHRQAVRASDMMAAVQQVAHALGIDPAPARTPVVPEAWIAAVVADLRDNAGASVVTAGYRQPPQLHALVLELNRHLGNLGSTMDLIAPAAMRPTDHTASLRELADAMRAGEVDTLLISGANPVYTAPADFGFADALAHAAFKVHHGLYLDETAIRCDWHVPASHALESWGDLRSFDGTVSLQQPCIAPLYDGKGPHELIGALTGDLANGREVVRAYWHERQPVDFEHFFVSALREGVVPNSASEIRRHASPATNGAQPATAAATPEDRDLEIVFVPDPRTLDGRFANNAWLQELPKPLSQLTWDNAALLSPALARRLRIENEDVIELRIGERSVAAPAWIMPGMADRSVTLALGYGRTSAGSVGNQRGANAYVLRTGATQWLAAGAALVRTGRRHALACTQTHHGIEGRDIVRSYSVAQAGACTARQCGTPDYRARPTVYETPPMGPYAWAMSVDLSACIGCGTCTVACQAENNIPVVGPDEVRNGREMHWIRVDRYYEGAVDHPDTLFQPVPCMQCEHAPCEVVCPVEASVHDAQGINVQVYNRCVGTRFCSNNCPYKVRRFNFFQYSKDVPGLNAQRNPEVTVRMRGVMEKCNYCLQRITTAKIAADREGRRLRDGEVVTACQAACPTRAIVFGDLNDPRSAVNRRKASPLDYALLAELNTRPRTTYLARVTNKSPTLRAPSSPHADGAADGHVADDRAGSRAVAEKPK